MVHVSDLHCIESDREALKRPELEGLRPNGHVKAMVRIVKGVFDGAFVGVTGDLTDDGAKEQVDRAYNLLAPIRGNLLPVPGNHDARYLGVVPWDDRLTYWRERFLPRGALWLDANKTVYAIEPRPSVKVIGIDTSGDRLSLAARGEFSDEQATAFLAEALEAKANAQTVVVLLHHHPFEDNNWLTKMDGGDLFLELVTDAADLVLFGHEHVAGTFRRHTTTLLASHACFQKLSRSSRAVRVVDLLDNGLVEFWWHEY